MIEVFSLEGKTKEELLEQIDKDNVNYIIDEAPAKLFKGKKYIIKYVKSDDVKQFIKQFINNIASSMNKEVNFEIRYKDECYSVMLITDDNAVFIGKDGRTLNAIQHLLHQSLTNNVGFNIKINVDAANYKLNREKRFEREIKNIAKEVITTKIEVKLDPMNSYERRIVHNIIGEYEELKSESFGSDPTRYVIISYKED